jgi:hypothetical protein
MEAAWSIRLALSVRAEIEQACVAFDDAGLITGWTVTAHAGRFIFKSRWKMGEHSARNALAGLRDNQTAAPLAHGRRAKQVIGAQAKSCQSRILPPPNIPGACGQL